MSMDALETEFDLEEISPLMTPSLYLKIMNWLEHRLLNKLLNKFSELLVIIWRNLCLLWNVLKNIETIFGSFLKPETFCYWRVVFKILQPSSQHVHPCSSHVKKTETAIEKLLVSVQTLLTNYGNLECNSVYACSEVRR